MIIGNKIHIGSRRRVILGSKLNLKQPTDFVSVFNVDTISADLSWTDTNAGKAMYMIYRSTNGGIETLIATTSAGATSYSDAGCKQNASVIYKIKTKGSNKFSSAIALVTPLCLKMNQSTLTTAQIFTLTLITGKSINIEWGDGTNNNYSGQNTNITHDYSVIGQYNVVLTGDIDYILIFGIRQSIWYGSINNWTPPGSLTSISLWSSPNVLLDISTWDFNEGQVYIGFDSSGISGDITGKSIPSSCNSFKITASNVEGKFGQIGDNAIVVLDLFGDSSKITGFDTTTFRIGLRLFDFKNQRVIVQTSEIDKVLNAMADWFGVNPPTQNCTINLSGANMGIPTGGASNVDIARLVGYYTAAGKTATVIVRTS